MCEDANSKFVDVVSVAKKHIDDSLVGECVRSNINFHPRNQDVEFDLLEMFFSFQCTKYDENRWLNTKLFKKRDVTA